MIGLGVAAFVASFLAVVVATGGGAPVSSAVPIARVQTEHNVVALTFDACASLGQSNGFDRGVFDILKAEELPATVFLSGRWIEAHPDAAFELATQPHLEFGNHGYAHTHMPVYGRAKIAAEIDRTESLIHALGRTSVGLRPPFGEWSPAVLQLAAERGLPTILWDVVSGDAGGHVEPARMVNAVVSQTRPGSIVIFHINGRGPHTRQALPAILAGLRARGLRFVTLSELLAASEARLIAAPHMRRGVPVRTSPRAASVGVSGAPPPAAGTERALPPG